MEFKGVSKKKGIIIIVGFVLLVTLLNYAFNNQVSMVATAIGMIIAGGIGVKLNSYTFISRDSMVIKDSKKFESFVLFMNFFLIFLGVVIIYQQMF